MQKDKKYYDDFFTKYPINIHDNPARFLAVSNLLSGKVLDVACGTGTLSDYYGGEYTGVDISDVAINKARAVRRKGAFFYSDDFNRISLSYTSLCDCAYLGEFLEHIENDSNVFDNLIRRLKPDGKIFVTVPNGDRIPDESHCRTFTVPQIRRDYSKYGKVTFHNWEGFRDRILFSIDVGNTEKNDITLVMVVKDEAKGIENAILSALELVDYVIVSVDTKTTDKTAEIAKLYADDLQYHLWQNNFSVARNGVQKLVKTKWTLFLDGHEYIEKMGNIKELLKLDVEGLVCYIKMENGSKFMFPRIFRSHLRFENPVHNAINLKTQQYAPKFVIVHDRDHLQTKEAAAARAKQRGWMIPKLMKERLEINPNDQRALFNLGNWYIGKFELKQALHYYKRCYKFTPTPDERYFIKAQIGIAHQLQGHLLRALFAFHDLEKLIPNRWETKRLIGGVYIAKGMYKSALPYLTFALEGNQYSYLYGLFGHDLAELWDLIASCYSELGENEKAVIAWKEAIKNTSDLKRKGFFMTKIQLSLMLCKDPNVRIFADDPCLTGLQRGSGSKNFKVPVRGADAEAKGKV